MLLKKCSSSCNLLNHLLNVLQFVAVMDDEHVGTHIPRMWSKVVSQWGNYHGVSGPVLPRKAHC